MKLENPEQLAMQLLIQAREGELEDNTRKDIEDFLGKVSDDLENDFGITFFDNLDDFIDVQGEDYFFFDEDEPDRHQALLDAAEEEVQNDDFLFELSDGSLINFSVEPE